MNLFSERLNNAIPFTNDEVHDIYKMSISKETSSKQILFTPDKPFIKLWFLESGIIRAFRVIEGKDITFFFFNRGEFAVDYESYLNEEPSTLYFESLTKCKFIEFSKRSILSLYQQHPKFETFGRIMAETAYLSATNRLKQHQAEPLEVRYQNLLKKDPELFQLVPQYHIASFLGVSPQSLSRLIAKRNNKIY